MARTNWKKLALERQQRIDELESQLSMSEVDELLEGINNLTSEQVGELLAKLNINSDTFLGEYQKLINQAGKRLTMLRMN